MKVTKAGVLSGLLLLISQLGYGQGRAVAITFDDLPGTQGDKPQLKYVNQSLLATLTEQKIPAIGFVNESKLYREGSLDNELVGHLSAWLDAGMELGNHTYSHVFINQTPIEEYKQEVLDGEKVIGPLINKYGGQLRYFRHTQLRTGPTEEYRQQLNAFLSEQGYIVAPVTIDNDEYIYAYCYYRADEEGDEELKKELRADYLQYLERIFTYYENLSAGFLGYEPKQILLLHANLLNADVLPKIVDLLRAKGYSFIGLEEALADEAYDLPVVQSTRGLSWIHRWMLAQGKQPPTQPQVPPHIRQMFNAYRR